MNKFKFAFQVFTLVGLFFAFSVIANAQTRAWVSGVGDDINPCSRTAPCRTFSRAHTVVASGGEINCLDPGSYGTLTITKSVTIDCEDTQGAISASSTVGITINAASISVNLRGISINGMATGTNCIRILGSGTVKVSVDEVVCSGFATHGISIETSTGSSKVVVFNSSFRNIVGNGINTFVTGTGSTTVSVDSCLFSNTGVGINFGVASVGSIVDSTVSNSTTGIQAAGATSFLNAAGNQIVNNGTGVSALSSATIRIGKNHISGNGTGLSGTNIFTWTGNQVDGNTPGGNGSNNGAALIQ
jgi:hypothetical protein